MRKLFFTIIVVFMTVSLITVSCKKDGAGITDTEKCNQLAEVYQQAITNYATNPNTETCEAFIQSLENYINGCSVLTAEQRREFQEDIDETDCSQ